MERERMQCHVDMITPLFVSSMIRMMMMIRIIAVVLVVAFGFFLTRVLDFLLLLRDQLAWTNLFLITSLLSKRRMPCGFSRGQNDGKKTNNNNNNNNN
jgi:hypothetical protein